MQPNVMDEVVLPSGDTGNIFRVAAHKVLVYFPIVYRVWIPKDALVWALGNRKYRGAGKWRVTKEWANAPKTGRVN